MIATSWGYLFTLIVSKLWMSPTRSPSRIKAALSREGFTLRVISLPADMTSGLDVKSCGARAVSTSASTVGSRIGPPADREYPVEPVGVHTRMPSAVTVSYTHLRAHE